MNRELVYLGWQGYNNFGDDLLHDTWRAALDAPLDVQAPLHTRAHLRRAPQTLALRLRSIGTERLVLLGGGTTIGFGTWAGHVRRAGFAYGADVVGLGLGAAESTDAHLLSTQPQDWAAWRRDTRFHLAGVRGPLSRREVEDNLGPAEVVGDPALLYPVVRPVVPRGDRAIGVALGSDPVSRFDLDVIAELVEHRAVTTGSPVRIFALAEADRATARALAARLRIDPEIHEYDHDVHTTMEAIASCSVLVSERLHGAIAAAALDVPTVPLAYASKCDDFWMSVTGDRPSTNPGASPAQIGHAIDTAHARRTTVRTNVARLQGRLVTLRDRLVDWTRGEPLRLDQLTNVAHDTDDGHSPTTDHPTSGMPHARETEDAR